MSAKNAVLKVFNEYLLPLFKKQDSFNFRKRLWSIECDAVYMMYQKAIKEIYQSNFKKDRQGAASRCLYMDSFIELIVSTGVINENFYARDVGIQFNLAMMT
jgi:hypothetical protein